MNHLLRCFSVLCVVIVISCSVSSPGTCQNREVTLVSFSVSTCDETLDTDRLLTRIVSTEHRKGSLFITIATTATCCVSFTPSAEVKNGILYLGYQEYGSECECDCCYQFVYELAGASKKKFEVMFRNKVITQSDEQFVTYPIRFRIHEGDTIDYQDKYGFRQGRWSSAGDSLLREGYLEFVDGVVMRIVKLYPDGSLKSVVDRYWRYREYFQSGKLKRECLTSDQNDFYRNGTCREWNESGEVIFEGPYK